MIGPDTEVTLRETIAERLRMTVAARIPAEQLQIHTLHDVARRFADEIAVRVDIDVLGDMRPVEYLTATRDHTWQYPATWWDHWKETHAGRWWASWWIRRHPPRHTTRHARFTTTIPVQRRVLFPDATLALPPLGQPVRVLTPQTARWEPHYNHNDSENT